MSSLLLILLGSVLVTIMVLARMPQWRPFVAVTGIFDGAGAIAVACLITVPITAVLSWAAAELLSRWELQYLRTPAFVAIALTVVPLVETALRRQGKLTPERPGFALLMLTSSTLPGVALIADSRINSLAGAALFAGGAAVAFGALLIAFAALYERLRYADVPAAFREAPLALMTAGIMALAFMGFTGLIQE